MEEIKYALIKRDKRLGLYAHFDDINNPYLCIAGVVKVYKGPLKEIAKKATKYIIKHIRNPPEPLTEQEIKSKL